MRATEEVGVSIRGIYQGYALQQVDEKGRVAIPSSLRATLIARSACNMDPKDAAQIVIAQHESDTCLVGYDVPQREERFAALELRAKAYAGPDGAMNDEILRRGMAWDTLPFDSSGRFIFPTFPRKRAKIGRYAFFYGLGSHFEIWDPAQVLASARTDETMREMVLHFLEERGETL